jgi:MerR family transcriptional regulator, light-induced transcriptional regulator
MASLGESSTTKDTGCAPFGEVRLEVVPLPSAVLYKDGVYKKGAYQDNSATVLVSTIEIEVIPRLMFAFKLRENADSREKLNEAALLPTAADVEQLVKTILDPRDQEPAAFVAECLQRGIDLEHLYLGLLAPAARRLGELWDDDECDFSSVTLGIWRLHKIIHECSAAFQAGHAQASTRRTALLAPAPGSQHTFGIIMVSEFFRREGWDICGGPDHSEDEILEVCKGQWLDLLGLSLGSELHASRVRDLITRARQVALNPAMIVMVGGAVCDGSTDLATELGADAASNNATVALEIAHNLVSARGGAVAG